MLRPAIFCLLAFFLGHGSALAGPLWVAVGESGRRVSSPNGSRWNHDQRWDGPGHGRGVLHGVAFGRLPDFATGIFIAGGGDASGGVLLSTLDGQEWTEVAKVKHRIGTIAFGRDRFV